MKAANTSATKITNCSRRPATLEHLARDPDDHVRAGAACHPNTPLAALERLVTDPSYHVRVTMAEGQGNLRLLERLAVDEDFGVVAAIANSPHPAALRRLAWQTLLSHESLPLEILDWAFLPPEVLIKFAKHSKSQVRERVIRHDNAPIALLEQLKHDPVKRVRDRATRKLQARGYR